MYARHWKIYSLSVRKFGFSVQFHKQFLVDSYVHRRRMDAQNLGIEASNQIDGIGRIANQIDIFRWNQVEAG